MNYKKIALATVCLAITWFVMDFVIHGILLMDQYEATKHLWRPMEEMNHWMMSLVTLFFSFIFTMFYTSVVKQKTTSQGLKFGLWYGLALGLAMGGMYCYMPITFALAVGWFFGTLAESLVGGIIVGYLTREA